jgi:protein-S-isoprenylcysteine O-methyltransferase Ste14
MRAALQRYCAAKIEDNRRRRRFITRKALRLFGYATLMMVLAVALMFMFYTGPLMFLPEWLRGSLTILAAFAAGLAIWNPLDSLLFDWAPFVRDNAIYTQISALDLRFEAQPC